MNKPQRLLLDQRLCAGDALVMSAAIRDLMTQYPGAYELQYVGHHGTLAGPNNLYANSPYMTHFYDGPPHDIQSHYRDCRYIMLDYAGGGCFMQNGVSYPSHTYGSNVPHRYHFIQAFHESLGMKLGLQINVSQLKPEIYLSPEEKQPWPGLPPNYWVIDAGRKADFTAKFWGTYRFQQVVNATKDRITWVQIGSACDYHPPLENVINLIGQTSLRQLAQVFYGAAGVLTPVSLPMHLSAALLMPSGRHRPCVVLMGRREQKQWEAYPYHTVLGTEGQLLCGEPLGGGCWRNKTIKIDNDDSVCRNPLLDETGYALPGCLHRITAADVVKAIELYL